MSGAVCTMEIEVKKRYITRACPMCDSVSATGDVMMYTNQSGTHHNIRCTKCGTKSGVRDNQGDALIAWNTRGGVKGKLDYGA